MFDLFAYGDAGWGDELVRGTLVTLALAVFAFPLGMLFGLAGAAMKLARSALVRAPAEAYTAIVRGAPEILILFLLFFGGSRALSELAGLFAGEPTAVEVDPFIAGAVALGFVSGAYCTEVFRGAILAVPRGQIEAAQAVGMSRWLIATRILLPQVWRYALPGLGNLWLVMLKDTSLVSVVGLDELVRSAYVAGGSTREYLAFYLAATVLFLALTTLSMLGLHVVERRAGRGARRA